MSSLLCKLIVMEPRLKELAHVVRNAMNGKTQIWLAQQSGTTNSTISRLLNAKNVPSPETLKRVSKVLNLDLYHLMALAAIPLPKSDIEKKLDPSAIYIAQRLSRLPFDIRIRMLSIISGILDVVEKKESLLQKQ